MILNPTYDTDPASNTGRLLALDLDSQVLDFVYDSTTGALADLLRSDGSDVTFTWHGPLEEGQTWTGTGPDEVNGSVSYTWTSDFQLHEESVQAGSTVTYGYEGDLTLDGDGLLVSVATSSQTLTLGRDPDNGHLGSTTIGTTVPITESYTPNTYGELEDFAAEVNGQPLWTYHLELDDLVRIESQTETLNGITSVTTYGYDAAGRLEFVQIDTDNDSDIDISESNGYDKNGNRYPDGESNVDVDEQDRLRTYGELEFTYTAHGVLASRTNTGEEPDATTTYLYDALGQLRQVDLPDGTTVSYGVDALGRRVTRSVDSGAGPATTHRFLYHGARVVAELDNTGAVTSRYIYGSRSHVPDLLVRGSSTYRLLSDVRGSVRWVVEVDTGTVVQQLDYDAWGNVLSDTHSSFQPFGFAGGLYDPLTGLVRFGARDYDPEVGRWTAKDPILFGGGDSLLYGYCGGDPVNCVDPSGLRIKIVGPPGGQAAYEKAVLQALENIKNSSPILRDIVTQLESLEYDYRIQHPDALNASHCISRCNTIAGGKYGAVCWDPKYSRRTRSIEGIMFDASAERGLSHELGHLWINKYEDPENIIRVENAYARGKKEPLRDPTDMTH